MLINNNNPQFMVILLYCEGHFYGFNIAKPRFVFRKFNMLQDITLNNYHQ